jgi:hypothetical protein
VSSLSCELSTLNGAYVSGNKGSPGGPFIMLADIAPASVPGETRLTVYGRTNAKERTIADESLPAWALGTPAKCPLE